MPVALERTRVALIASDPISRAGLAAAVDAGASDIVGPDDPADAVVIVADRVDDETTTLIRRHRRAGLPVVLVVTELNDQALFTSVEAGVCAVLRRDEASHRQVGSALRRAVKGDGSMAPDLLGRLMTQGSRLGDDVITPSERRLNGLTDREIEVLRLVADGMATAEIAIELNYSERTIKNVIQSVTTRLQLRNRSHAVAWALRHGLI